MLVWCELKSLLKFREGLGIALVGKRAFTYGFVDCVNCTTPGGAVHVLGTIDLNSYYHFFLADGNTAS